MTEASRAVESALENLLVEQSNEAQLAAATARSAASLKEENEALCGAGKTSCDTRIVFPTITYPGLTPAPSCPPSGTDIGQFLDCFVQSRIDGFSAMNIAVAAVVAEQFDAPAVPAFLEFGGGKLQQLLIEQWTALHEPFERVDALKSASNAAKARIATAQAELQGADQLCQQNCSAGALAEAIVAGTSVGVSTTVGGSVGCAPSASASVTLSAGYTPGPLIQQKSRKCRDVCVAVGAAQARPGAVDARGIRCGQRSGARADGRSIADQPKWCCDHDVAQRWPGWRRSGTSSRSS